VHDLLAEERPAEALALFRGEPLSDFAYEPFAQAEIARLEELRLGVLEERIEHDLERARHAQVVGELESLVREHPLRERFSGQLMLALYRSGRQAEALEVYQRARRRSVDELGIEPGPALRELERKILNQEASLGPPPGEAPAPHRLHLPRIAYAGIAIVVAVLAVAAVLASRDSSAGLESVPPNAVGVIDPETNRIVAAIPVGIRPGPVAAGDGSVWVGNLQDRSVTRIDTEERSVVRTVSVQDRTPTGLTVGNGAVWVAHGLIGELSRVETQFGRVTQSLSVAGRASTGSVAIGAGYVWAAYGDATLARIRPDPVRLDASTVTGAIPAAVVVVGRSVWVTNSGDATVQRFDAATFEEGAIRSFSVGGQPGAIAFGAGALWVANRADDSLTRIDPRTGSTSTIQVGEEPVSVAVGGGAVWVSNAGDGTVSRIDPRTDEVVDSISLGSVPAGIALADGVVWVAAQAPSSAT
jgi:YVTN family beta-propeller protein